MSYTKPEIKHSGDTSSDGIQVTPSSDYLISFTKPVNAITIKAESSDMSIKFNNGTSIHLIRKGERYQESGRLLSSFTIIESGVEYSYSALEA